MSDNDSVSSLPTSPVTVVPDSPKKRNRKLAQWDNPQRTGPASVVSETTEGNGDYFGPANLPFSFSSASLALSAVPQEWSSSRHGFHGMPPSGLIVHCPHVVRSNFYRSKQPPQAIRPPEGSRAGAFCHSSCSTPTEPQGP